MKLKEESENIGLKLSIQKTKIMESGPITLWQIDGKTTETVRDFMFWGSKITADGDCNYEIKRCLLVERETRPNLDSILKSRDFAFKGPSSQSYGFSSSHVQMWELDYKESWAPNNWCSELWYWRRLFRVPWTARRSNQSILKEINPEYSLEGPMLKLQYFGCLMQWVNSLGKTWFRERLKAGGEGDNRGWDGWMASLTQ